MIHIDATIAGISDNDDLNHAIDVLFSDTDSLGRVSRRSGSVFSIRATVEDDDDGDCHTAYSTADRLVAIINKRRAKSGLPPAIAK